MNTMAKKIPVFFLCALAMSAFVTLAFAASGSFQGSIQR